PSQAGESSPSADLQSAVACSAPRGRINAREIRPPPRRLQSVPGKEGAQSAIERMRGFHADCFPAHYY
ncbi:MAG: hypothetical protein QXQ02_10480, partial [Halobacteria archaeon]